MKKILTFLFLGALPLTILAFDLGSALNSAIQQGIGQSQNTSGPLGNIGGLFNTTNMDTQIKHQKSHLETQIADTSIPNEAFALAKVDKLCEKPVSDWDVSQNLIDLGMTSVDLWAGGTSTADRQQATLRQFKHRNWLPMALEEKLGDLYHSSQMADKVIADPAAEQTAGSIQNEIDRTLDSVSNLFGGFNLSESTPNQSEVLEEDLSDLGIDMDSEACGVFCGELEKGKIIWSKVEKYLDNHPKFKNHPYTWKFHMVKPGIKINGKDFNNMAIAMPGGHVYMGSGLINNPNIAPEAVEMLLIHEASHSLKRHHTKKVQGILIDTLGSIDKIKTIISGGTQDLEKMGELITIFAEFDAIINGFPKAQEYEADACSIRAIHQQKHVNSLARYVEEYTSDSNSNYGTRDERVKHLQHIHHEILQMAN